jgi:hypothetical protein
MSNLYLMASLDAAVVLAVIFLTWRSLTFYHPLFLYLFFHAYSVTFRIWTVIGGAPTMYADSDWALRYRIVTLDEIARGVFWADMCLALLALGVLWAHKEVSQRKRRGDASGSAVPLNRNLLRSVFLICLPVGLTMLAMQRLSVGEESQVFYRSGYLSIIAMWPLGCLAGFVFSYGFRAYFLIPFAAIILLYSTQGFHRVMFLLPLLTLAAVYLVHKGKRWPPILAIAAMVPIIVFFPTFKYLGPALVEGNYERAGQLVRIALYLEDGGYVAHENYLDQLSGAMTLADEKGVMLLGYSYLSVLALPVPRSWWPDKPSLGEHALAVATLDRPYDVEGRIVTYIGESYVNFGYFGVVAVAILLGWSLTRWYLFAIDGPRNSLKIYVYITVFASLVQLFRDGVLSLIVFGMIFNTPMILVWMVHALLYRKRHGVDPAAVLRPAP